MTTRNGNSYAIGYGKPPKEYQFAKGKSGNPRGKKKGRKDNKTLVREMFDEKIIVAQGGEKRAVSRLEAMILSLFNQALQGKAQPAKLLLDLAEKADAAHNPMVDGLGLDDPKLAKIIGNFPKPDIYASEFR